jgi:type IV pilus assembly protein PilN
LIRLNLLTEHSIGEGKDAVGIPTIDPATGVSSNAMAGARAGLRFSALLSGGSAGILAKIGAAAAPLVAVLLFEQIELASKNSEKSHLSEQLATLTKESDAMKPKIVASKKLKEEKGKLQVQIDTIKKLSKERLYNVKAMNALQTLIPPKAWLTHLQFENDKVKMSGKSADESSVFEFVKGLEGSIFFSGVNIVKVEDVSDVEGTNKQFELTCKLESL